MFDTVAVAVLRPIRTVDRFGNEVDDGFVEESVEGVLVSPGGTADMEAARPDGATVSLTLHFPKSYSGSLEGCSMRLPDPWAGTYRVVGNPLPYIDGNTPGRWNRPVEVEAAHG